MKNITIYNPCNEHTRYYRAYNLFWDKLTEKLKTKFNVTENRYFEFANSKNFDVELKSKTPNTNFYMMECEYVIQFDDTHEIYVLSVADDLSCAMLEEKNNPLLKKVLISQFNKKIVEHHVHDNIHKYFPWVYFPSAVHNLEQYFYKRKAISNLRDKMVFRGSSIQDRPIVTYMNTDVFDGPHSIGGPESYFNDIINYKVGLSVAGRGELCYRDIEYMAIGLPFIRFEYFCEMSPNLIPNYHYISVDRPQDLLLDRNGDESHAKLIEERFMQVKDDIDFLNFVANNAREYYLKYIHDSAILTHTLDLLGI